MVITLSEMISVPRTAVASMAAMERRKYLCAPPPSRCRKFERRARMSMQLVRRVWRWDRARDRFEEVRMGDK